MAENESTGTFNMNSKAMKSALIIISVLLIFIGPTYVPYLMSDLAGINYYISVTFGGVLLVVGLLLMWFLIRKKIIT
jgi:Ca2+/H+ antiporter